MQNLFSIIRRPVVTERAANLRAQSNQYVFRVNPESNKHEIRSAIEKLFKVKVLGVNTMNVRGKSRRMGQALAGSRTSWKKAIITLEKGQEIKFAEETE